MIHQTAVVHPSAQVDPSVLVGPYAIIDEYVVVGPHCRLGPQVHLTGGAIIGSHNHFHTGCVIGDAPQDLKYKGGPTRLQIGDHNTFREHVTVHRSNKAEEQTVIASHNYFMAHSHVGHNSVVGNHVILANGALLGGHASVGDGALLSGNCLVHQFVRVGTLALMQGGAAISKDLPPFTMARRTNLICGLNTIGLRRAGFSSQQRLALKTLYHLLFRSGQKLSSALAQAQKEFTSDTARTLLDFVAASKRGVCRDTGEELEETEDESND